MSVVVYCGCSESGGGARYQSEKHGKGFRVHNPTTKKQGETPIYRCTCCGSERAVSLASSKERKGKDSE